jgi:hypothetical protein
LYHQHSNTDDCGDDLAGVMISSDDIQTIISGAQSAALDDSLWQGWAENIINASDSSGANFVVISKTVQFDSAISSLHR